MGKILDLFIGKLAGHLVDFLSVAIEKTVYMAMEKYELGRVNQVEKEILRIEAELRVKPRITEDEAMDYARRINDSRRKL